MRRWAVRHRGWAAVLAFAALALIAFFAYRTLFKAGSAGTVSYVTQAAETGTLVVSVSGTGNVALGQTYDVVPAVTGVVRGLTVKVGDTVAKGQVLFTLENAQLDANVTSAKAGYSQAQASLYNAEAQVEQAEQSLAQLRDAAVSGTSNPVSTSPPTTAPLTTHPPTSRPPTSSTAFPTTSPPTTSPPTTLPPTTAPPTSDPPPTSAPPTTAPLTTDPSVALLNSGAQPRAVVALAAARGTTTATTASTGQQTAAVTQDDIEIAEKQLAAAQASLAAARANLTNADFSLQQARATADERTVTAPAAGKITVLPAQEGLSLGSSSASSSSANTGSSQASGQGTSSGGQSSQAAATIVDPRSISVVVQLNEVDIPQVKVGQKATLTFDALPNLTLTGAVTVVDVSGTVSQGVVTYNVTVVPDTASDQVRAGMTASASIVTNVRQDVVLVPSAAVKTNSNGGYYVQLLVNGAPQQRTVEVGLTNDTSTEITSGLAAGDRVVTQTIEPNATQTTLPSRQGGFGGAGGFLPGGGGRPGGG